MSCATASPPTSWRAASTFASSRCCSKQTHTARHHPIEGWIYYPFHPRCGETVLILKQYAYRGTDLVVIPQPDGTVACIPAWMTRESAAQLKLCVEPHLSLDVLRALRTEADALLRSLRSDSGMEEAKYEAQCRETTAGSVRSRRAPDGADSSSAGAAGGVGRGLLREIAAALTSGEVGDDQDHG